MLIPNQKYVCTPPNGDPALPIVILGMQAYSPGQSHRSDVWVLEVPDTYSSQLPDGTECASFAEVCRMIARSFFDGNVDSATKSIVPA